MEFRHTPIQITDPDAYYELYNKLKSSGRKVMSIIHRVIPIASDELIIKYDRLSKDYNISQSVIMAGFNELRNVGFITNCDFDESDKPINNGKYYIDTTLFHKYEVVGNDGNITKVIWIKVNLRKPIVPYSILV